MTEPKNILVIRTDRIGDVVLTLPVAHMLKRKYPGCKVTFLVRKYTAPCVKNNPWIDEVLEITETDGSFSLFPNVKMMRLKKFDACIVVSPSFKIALAVFISAVKIRIGTGYRWYSFLFNRRNFEHRKDARFHELEYNARLLNLIGIDQEINKSNAVFGLNPGKKSDLKIRQLLSEKNADLNKPVVIIHPGSGGSAADLPVSSFIKLAGLLAQQLNITLIVTGSETEKAMCSAIASAGSAVNMAGLLNLDEFIALIGISEMLIANSTGPIHLAAALGKLTVGFYPRVTACSKERWGPYSERSIVFEPEIQCSNCTIDQCRQLNCMESINIDRVAGSISKALNGQYTEK